MKQVVVIHGGNPHVSYDSYIESLKQKDVSLDSLTKTNWRMKLQEDLGPQYQVLPLKMPCKENAKYSEWKIWFERFVPLLNDEIILVGHSLGAIFLVKYLSEQTLPKELAGLFLISPPLNPEGMGESLADFIVNKKLLDHINEQTSYIHFYHSSDDGVVPFSNFEEYCKLLPKATPHQFTDRGHFSGDNLPEIIEDIKRLS